MNIVRTFSLLVAGAVCAITANAQDKLHLRNGDDLEVKVIKVEDRDIIYKKWNNQQGPDYIIKKKEVELITYENGTTDDLATTEDEDDEPRRRDPRGYRSRRMGNNPNTDRDAHLYKNNIISIAPVQMTNEGPAGVGVSYERVLDKKGLFSINIPLALTFYTDDNNNNNYPYSSNTATFFNAYPGLKIYPFGSRRKVSYSVGPSVEIGFGKKYNDYNNYGTNPYYPTTYNAFQMGLMVTNGLNIQPTPHFSLGIELGIGVYYYKNQDGNGFSYSIGDDDTPLVQFNFKLGYRF